MNRADWKATSRDAARRRRSQWRCRRGRERREHPCSRCCEPLLRSRGAPAQHDLLVRVSILITCEYPELFSLSALTNGANCPSERRNTEYTRVNVGPVRVRTAATRRAATVTRCALLMWPARGSCPFGSRALAFGLSLPLEIRRARRPGGARETLRHAPRPCPTAARTPRHVASRSSRA